MYKKIYASLLLLPALVLGLVARAQDCGHIIQAGGDVRVLALERLSHPRPEQIGECREAEGEGGDIAGRAER